MLPKDPAKVVQEAQLAGLRALVQLLYEKTNSLTRHIYSRAQKRLKNSIDKWEESLDKGTLDFSCIMEKENTFRVDELENIWITTGMYGNGETRRVKSERDGFVGPVNNLISILGALLRDLTLFMLPLKEPVRIGKKKTKTVWGYESNEVGAVPVAHGADLAELDLADMIRSHGRELARKAFIDSVEYNEFRRYAYLLVRRLIPFIEYIYTDGRRGRKSFHRPKNEIERQSSDGPCADDILRELTNEITSFFGTKRGRVSRPSREKPKRASTLVKTFFEDQIRELLSEINNLPKSELEMRERWAKDLRNLIGGKKPRLRQRDAEEIKEHASIIARWEGTRCHNIMTLGFVQPFNLTELFKGNIETQDLDSRFAIATEVPIDTARGKGKADIVLLQHLSKESVSSSLKPVAVFELKTRTGFNWYLRPKNLKTRLRDKKTGKPRKKVIGKILLRKRWLNGKEWEREIGCIPTLDDHNQLVLYEKGLIGEYQSVSTDESITELLKGVILIDSQIDLSQARRALYSLMKSVDYDRLKELSDSKPDRIIVRSKNPLASKICIVLDSPRRNQLDTIIGDRQRLQRAKYNPFEATIARRSEFMLYLSVRSASRSGRTAAWIAKYWHGVQFIQQFCEKKKIKNIVWFDLSGDFAYKPLSEVRLRLQSQSRSTKQFFDHINFMDFSTEVDRFLFRGGQPPLISSELDEVKQSDSLVIVSGWEFVEQSCPSRLYATLQELERVLVHDLTSSESHVLWFGRAPTYEQTSLSYGKHCHIPFHDNSSLRQYITRIVWNMPLKPYALTHTAPMLDDLRVIIDQSKTYDSVLFEIPILKKWSARFWSQRSKRDSQTKPRHNKGRQPLTAKDVLSDRKLADELKENALDLIPWIRDPSRNDSIFPSALMDFDLQYIPIFGNPSPPMGVLSRVTYRKRAKGGKGRRSVAKKPVFLDKQITHARQYRKRKIEFKPIKESLRAPMEELLVLKKFSEKYSDKTELRRFRRV
ncbi:MAG: hypothetical protein ACFFF4_12720, partial [Candidatus Thorarchaeota archaeon]